MTAFIDSNVPIYANGDDHDLRQACVDVMRAIAERPSAITMSSEVLQEVFHVGLRRGDLGRAREMLYDLDLAVRGRAVSVTREDILTAAGLDLPRAVDARDRVHVAVMQRLGIESIITPDRGFELVPGIRRLDPLDFASWRDEVFAS